MARRSRPFILLALAVVSGGAAAYPSTLLMTACPAMAAGVGEIVVVMPPTPFAGYHRDMLALCHDMGISEVYRVGGAQAVAAMAYGVEGIEPVDMIVGPGNLFVALAKKHVFGTVGIDMIAGPSEILVLADGTTPPDWVAMDLFSQAEHDELAQSILLCPDAAYIDAVQAAIDRLLPTMPRREIIAKSLNDRGALILTRDMAESGRGVTAQALIDAMQIKPQSHEFDLREQPVILRYMNMTGG